MTIHNHASHATNSMPVSSEAYQTPSSLNSRVEEAAFDVLFSQKEPTSETEQLRFELNECKKTGSSYYTIVTWKGKKYRITVHSKKRKLAYSEADWQQVEHRTIKVLDKVQNSKHFFRGALQLHAKTKNKWKVTYENNTPHLERSVNKKVIRDFKKLFENQIKPISILPTLQPPKKLERASYSPSNNIYKPTKEEKPFFEFPKKILEKIKGYLRSIKLNTNEDTEAVKEERSPLKQVKDYFFPSRRNIDDFDDLASSDAASINSFKELGNREGNLDDNTSLGSITVASSHISSDSGSSYSPEKR